MDILKCALLPAYLFSFRMNSPGLGGQRLLAMLLNLTAQQASWEPTLGGINKSMGHLSIPKFTSDGLLN